ncbi:hypothetical protein AArcSl_1416 [Halalkaliarchaeum desulfuricum]|uniref:Yip1 domain-containing protein n=1 Tax=Halalkaliarchaeum desulfuricum TaxID=2055893 RepID=A0A343TIX5_9EURY|nr:Yip1 family protein [Halalkaliarchaeum desulfuricum]AUX09047.1 hypothetical protein AArcSl_1416 [Halalkaliarchaeum desulfuricum]
MALQERARPAEQLLRSPREFFRERRFATSAAAGFVVVLALAIVLAASVWYLGGLLAASTDATVTMDNPDRPPEWVCDTHGDDPDSIMAENCDEPATIERDAGSLLWEAAGEYVVPVFFFTLLVWPIGGVVLFAAARIAGGDGGFLATLGVAAWGAVPEFFRLAAGLAGLTYVLSTTTFTGPVESFPDQVLAALAPLELPLLVASMLTLLWQWYLLSAGIGEVHDLDWPAAAFAVGIPLAAWGLFGLL